MSDIENRFNDFLLRLNNDEMTLTKFLDDNEQREIRKVFKDKAHFYGGFEESERKRCIIFNYDVEESDYDIHAIASRYNEKYANITHRHVLGTIYSLGLDRSTYGDIIINDGIISIFVTKDVMNYLIENLKIILHQRVSFKEVDKINNLKINCKTVILNVASLRLDAVVSKGCNISRSEAVDIINSGNVSVNHLEVLNTSYQIKENDILSIRHFGRIEIKRIIGLSKKNRINIEVNIKK